MSSNRKYYMVSRNVSETYMYYFLITWATSWENLSLGCPTRSHRNQAIQPKKMARGLKIRIKKVERLCYLFSENKGWSASWLHRRWSAPLFSHMQKAGFLMLGLIWDSSYRQAVFGVSNPARHKTGLRDYSESWHFSFETRGIDANQTARTCKLICAFVVCIYFSETTGLLKTLQKSSPEPAGRFSRNLVCSIWDSCPS